MHNTPVIRMSYISVVFVRTLEYILLSKYAYYLH